MIHEIIMFLLMAKSCIDESANYAGVRKLFSEIKYNGIYISDRVNWCLSEITERTVNPSAELDKLFLEAINENKRLPWFIRKDGSNISPHVRNQVLAGNIKNGCQNLERIRILAKMANLHEEILLADEKPREKTWWQRIKNEKSRGYLPRERARLRSDPAIMKIIEEQSTQSESK